MRVRWVTARIRLERLWLNWLRILLLIMTVGMITFVLLPIDPFLLTNHIHISYEALPPQVPYYDETGKCFKLTTKRGVICAESIVGDDMFGLLTRMTCKVRLSEPPKMIISSSQLNQAHLGGCPDWNCQVMPPGMQENISQVEAFVVDWQDTGAFRRSSRSYVVYHDQEATSMTQLNEDWWNFMMNFHRRSPLSSPYGYTVKLAPQSYRHGNVISEQRVWTKNRTIAWFVSNCATPSKRERLVAQLQKHIEVDIYGECGPLRCEKKSSCENKLNLEYHFYAALENTVKEDYITEKVWHQGFDFDVVPIVLNKSTVERYLPPNSFIAIDQFKSVAHLAKYLKFLINNKNAYNEYFAWRRDHAVIYLDGEQHTVLERPWGMCQLCRLLWDQPLLKEALLQQLQWRKEPTQRSKMVTKKFRGRR